MSLCFCSLLLLFYLGFELQLLTSMLNVSVDKEYFVMENVLLPWHKQNENVGAEMFLILVTIK